MSGQSTENQINAVFDRIYESTYDEVLRFVAARCRFSADIADLIQNIYLLFYSRLLSKGPEHIRDPRRYLLRIARDELYRHYGRLAMLRRCIPVFSPGCELPAESLDFLRDDSLEDHVDAAALWERIAQKDPTTVTILTLYFVGDRKISEIARQIGEKESFVKNRLYRTIRELKAEFLLEEANDL